MKEVRFPIVRVIQREKVGGSSSYPQNYTVYCAYWATTIRTVKRKKNLDAVTTFVEYSKVSLSHTRAFWTIFAIYSVLDSYATGLLL